MLEETNVTVRSNPRFLRKPSMFLVPTIAFEKSQRKIFEELFCRHIDFFILVRSILTWHKTSGAYFLIPEEKKDKENTITLIPIQIETVSISLSFLSFSPKKSMTT
uniref:Uncharacterized protein n=1 Tax=Cacopsylla melanoneura TaxID=428564 RepID=A0A8D8XSL2_9HEMI